MSNPFICQIAKTAPAPTGTAFNKFAVQARRANTVYDLTTYIVPYLHTPVQMYFLYPKMCDVATIRRNNYGTDSMSGMSAASQ